MLRNAFNSLLMLIILCSGLQAQQKTENVVLVTIDGLRWQELFKGADPSLIKSRRWVANRAETEKEFWANDIESRRKKLFPFFWGEIASKGQLYGNRDFGNRVNLANRYWFSYPGYNELLTGRADKRIRSNAKKANPNQTILEFANHHAKYKDRVAAFASWEVFHYIINPKRSGIHVNAGNDTAKVRLTTIERHLNRLQKATPSPWKATRFDEFTHNYAREYLKKNAPRLVLIAYGETDEFAHQGKYDEYLRAANRTDRFIHDLWHWLQCDTRYRNKTTLIITTDHGRGSGHRSWRHHGVGRTGSNHTWFALLGPDNRGLGEIKSKTHYYTNDLTKAIASLLNLNFPQGESHQSIMATATAK
jgi:hypothetical protein